MAAIERPNRIVWDLDPGPAVTWKKVVKAGSLVRAVLKTLGLTSSRAFGAVQMGRLIFQPL